MSFRRGFVKKDNPGAGCYGVAHGQNIEAAPTGSPSAVSRTASSGCHYTLWDHLLPLEPPGRSRPAATDPAYLASRGTFPRPDNTMLGAVRNAVKSENK